MLINIIIHIIYILVIFISVLINKSTFILCTIKVFIKLNSLLKLQFTLDEEQVDEIYSST
jgi:hypothetical protein